MRRSPRVLAASLILVACGGDPAPSAPSGVITPIFQRGVSAPWIATTNSSAHEVGLDVGLARHGTSAYVRSLVPQPPTGSFGTALQQLSALGYRGQRLRLSGYVRADSINGRGAGLWMRVDTPTRTSGFDNMIEGARPITGSSDWTQYAVVLDVPQDAVGVTFGLLLSGGGVARVDDMRLEVVDASVPVTGAPVSDTSPRDSAAIADSYDRYPHAAENLDFEGVISTFNLTSAWLKANARPFATDQPGADLADLGELGSIVGNARVAAFGEATHGTSEFFRMKHRAFEYLVEKQGYTHFLIEATMPEARALDRYVATGFGDPAKLLAGLYFWTWNTQEVLDLITWMRGYNLRAGTPRLRFFGFDMQFPHQALDSLPAMLGRVGSAERRQGESVANCFAVVRGANGRLDEAQYARLPDTTKDGCAASLAALADSARVHREAWGAALGADDLAWLEQYVRLIGQWEGMARTTNALVSLRLRDRAMADNVLWIAGREPQARMFVWAHNGHVSRRPNAMGRHLATALGAQYRNVAFTFGGGRFNAISVLPNGTFGPLQVHTIQGPEIASALEMFLNATLEPRLILDTRKVLLNESGTTVLNRRPIPLRSIGSVYSPGNPGAIFEMGLLPQDYDGIIWFAGTRESRLLPFNQARVTFTTASFPADATR